MSVSSFLRLFIFFCEFNRRRRKLELLGKSEPGILSRWHEALDSLAVFYQHPSERELVVRALADPYFPFSKLRKLNTEGFTTETDVVDLSEENKARIVAGHLLKWAEIFLSIREELKRLNQSGLISNISPSGTPLEGLPETGYCDHCGGCCEIRGGPTEFTASFELPGGWPLYFRGDGCKSQRFCPFLFEYFASARFFCSIYQVKPKGRWEFGREECEFLHNDVARERSSRLSWEA
jgi:hypothetical protein